VIGLEVNDRAFRDELARELEGLEEDVTNFRKKVTKELRAKCEENSPRGKTGKLHKSWVVSAGGPDRNLKEGSDAQADAALAGLRPDQTTFVQSNDFRASFFENGTVNMSPRPIAAPALAAVEGMEER
jgi:hypothetical protein